MRIRRMIADKKRRTDLAVPPMVKEQWEKGTNEKNEMAQLLMDSNWSKDTTSLQVVFSANMYCEHVYTYCLRMYRLVPTRRFSSPS